MCGYGGGFGVRGQAVTATTLRLYALVYFLKVINEEVARALLIKPEACDLWHGERVTTQSGYRRIQWGLNYLAISLIFMRGGNVVAIRLKAKAESTVRLCAVSWGE